MRRSRGGEGGREKWGCLDPPPYPGKFNFISIHSKVPEMRRRINTHPPLTPEKQNFPSDPPPPAKVFWICACSRTLIRCMKKQIYFTIMTSYLQCYVNLETFCMILVLFNTMYFETILILF